MGAADYVKLGRSKVSGEKAKKRVDRDRSFSLRYSRVLVARSGEVQVSKLQDVSLHDEDEQVNPELMLNCFGSNGTRQPRDRNAGGKQEAFLR